VALEVTLALSGKHLSTRAANRAYVFGQHSQPNANPEARLGTGFGALLSEKFFRNEHIPEVVVTSGIFGFQAWFSTQPQRLLKVSTAFLGVTI
jgi:hypothetical protein